MSTWSDKFIEFFIKNYDDIKELNKLSEYVKGRLPSMLDSDMKDCIYKLQSKRTKVDSDKSGIWWFDEDEYDEYAEQGAFFAYEPKWDRLFSDNDSAEVAWLHFYVSTGKLRKKGEKKKHIDDLVSELKKKSDMLRQRGIGFEKVEDYSGDVLILKYPIQKQEIMVTIADRGKLRDTMQQAVNNFTETIRSILSALKPMPPRT